MVNSSKYDNTSIQVLKGLDAIRKRPGMYIGSTGIDGLHQLLYEVVDNSVDEHVAGYADSITIFLNTEENSIRVTDNGRGIPVDHHPSENKSTLEVVLTTIHAGGKFDNNAYNTSSGLHGIGISAVNALSESLIAEVHRDGKTYEQRYERGVPISDVLEKKSNEDFNGTSIYFKPDYEIFKALKFNIDTVRTRLIELAYLNPKLTIIFSSSDHKEESFHYKTGIKEYVRHLVGEETVLHKPIRVTKKSKMYSFDLVFQYNSGFKDNTKSFANNISTTEGGTHLNAVRAALLRYIREQIKSNKMLKKTNLEIMPKDVFEGIALVVSLKLPNPEFESQTKIKLNNQEIRQPMEDDIYEALCTKPFPSEVVEKIVNSVKVRDITKKARQLVRRKGIIDNTLPGKLADCTDNDPANCELFIVEGQSAAGSAKQGRNRKNQAILAIKGKILNVEKSTFNKILENEEIKSLVKATGVNINNPDLSKLRYHKVVILTDADVDGGHICCLLLTFFYRYFTELIKEGYLYVAQPPLYRVKKKDFEMYCVDDKQLEAVLKDNIGATVQRFKGLGEMLPNQLHDTILNSKNRNLLQVTIEDAEVANQQFEILMGNKVEERRNFIIENADEIYDNY